MVEQSQINELALALAEIPFPGGDDTTSRRWDFCGVDPMTGCIAYACSELGITCYCTPGWERDDAWIVISPSDHSGNLLDDDRAIPFEFSSSPLASAVAFRAKMEHYLRGLERAYPVPLDSKSP